MNPPRPFKMTAAGILNILGSLWGVAFGIVGFRLGTESPDILYPVCGSIVLLGVVFSVYAAYKTISMTGYSSALWFSGLAALLMFSLFSFIAWLLILMARKDCKEYEVRNRSTGIRKVQPVVDQPPPDPAHVKALDDACDLEVPYYLDPDITAQMAIVINNRTNMDFDEVTITLADMQKFFNIPSSITIPGVIRGMELRKEVLFTPKYRDGTFPVSIEIRSGNMRFTEKHTIKVGGTEIY